MKFKYHKLNETIPKKEIIITETHITTIYTHPDGTQTIYTTPIN